MKLLFVICIKSETFCVVFRTEEEGELKLGKKFKKKKQLIKKSMFFISVY